MKKFISFLLFTFCFAVAIFAQEGGADTFLSQSGGQGFPAGAADSADSALQTAFSEAAEDDTAYAEEKKPAVVAFSSFPKELKLAQDFTASLVLPEPATLDRKSYSQENFEILSAEADASGLNIEIKAVPFALGVSTFTALSFTGADGKIFTTEPITAEIKPVDTGIKEKKLLDIRSPYRPFNYWSLLWLLVIIPVLAGLYFVLSKRYVQKQQNKLKELQKDNRPLDVIALDRLDTLLSGNLWKEGEYKTFYIYLIDILRDYLSGRYSFDAHKDTSKELIRRLKRNGEFKGDLKALTELQNSADYVKFANVEPTQARMDEDVALMRNIIIDTRPPRITPSAEDKTEIKAGL